ncbi:MAG: DUF2238 domain-containing protein [Candidatus Delongbacteria bacterium]|nr:DUF2238 domain-containing protein [Candidatus Delongbacteria bacterium]
MNSKTTASEPLLLLIACLLALLVSGFAPFDRPTWWLEVFPVLIGLPLLLATWHRFPLTPLVYRLLFLHALILILGGHYSYARVPLGSWVQELFDLQRNHYDRIGHLAQGFIPALLTRELLRRQLKLSGRWLFFLVIAVCLGISAMYELIEWWAALIGGDGAQAFLGTQGDIWDTHWDMLLALTGAITAMLILPRLHDRQLAKLTAGSSV